MCKFAFAIAALLTMPAAALAQPFNEVTIGVPVPLCKDCRPEPLRRVSGAA